MVTHWVVDYQEFESDNGQAPAYIGDTPVQAVEAAMVDVDLSEEDVSALLHGEHVYDEGGYTYLYRCECGAPWSH